MDIGYKIKERRKELDLTQTELGQRVHKSSQVISNWERGYTTGIVSEDLRNLSIALEVPIEYLVPSESTNSFPAVKSTDSRLETIIREYENLDERSKDIIDAIINLNISQKK